jgi:F-type H+-transporting ATPase subunit epsilon
VANLTYVELITPERVLFSGEAEAVVMRTDGGDITFLANHMDYIAAVDICVVHLEGVRRGGPLSDGVPPLEVGLVPGVKARGDGTGEALRDEQAQLGEVFAAVHGGFVMVADNKVTIVAGVAELGEEIDVARARGALERAESAGGAVRAGGVPAPSLEAGEGAAAEHDAAADAAAARAQARLAAAGGLKADTAHL